MPKRFSSKLPKDRNNQRTVQPFKKEDWEKMTQICLLKKEQAGKDSPQYYIWYRNYILLVLGVNVGVRVSDLLSFTARTVAGGRIVIKASKTRKELRYDLDKGIYKYIKDYIDEFKISTNSFLFASTDQKGNRLKDPITRTQAYRIIKDLAKEAEIDYMVGTHSLRKSYGRWLYDSGMNLADIAKMMQHNSTDYTLRYICIDSEQMKENREGLHFDPKFKP